MNLPNDLLSQFVKITNDDKKTNYESTVYGTIVYDGQTYVRIDGSDMLTPVSTTAAVEDGERVAVTIRDHTAVVTGNLSSPAVRTGTMTEFENTMSYKVTDTDIQAAKAILNTLYSSTGNFKELTAEEIAVICAEINTLNAKYAELDRVSAKDVEALTADIESLRAIFGSFTNLSAENLEAVNAEIDQLKGYAADFTYVSADRLNAMKAEVREADIKYANIDFANIGKAAFEELFSRSGLIENIKVGDGFITGMLVGVTIKGDLIEGNTIVADKLVIKGDDGLYYKLNTQGITMNSYADKYVKMEVMDNPENDQVYSYITETESTAYCTLIDGEYYEVRQDDDEFVKGEPIDQPETDLAELEAVFTTDGDPVYSYTVIVESTSYCAIKNGVYFAVRADYSGFAYVKGNVIPTHESECSIMEGVFTRDNEQVYGYTTSDGVVAHCTIVSNVYYEVALTDMFMYTKTSTMSPLDDGIELTLIDGAFTTCAIVDGAFTTENEQVYSYIGNDGLIAYCVIVDGKYYHVLLEKAGTKYVKTNAVSKPEIDLTELEDVLTTDGDKVYYHTDEDGKTTYYAIVGDKYYQVLTEATGVKLEQTDYNSLNGSVITAKSITAEQISVKDLVAFGATIGGFKVSSNSIYSGVKDSTSNTTRGIYLDSDGQVNIGDMNNFIRLVKNDDAFYSVSVEGGTKYIKNANVIEPKSTDFTKVEGAFTKDNEQVYSYVDGNGDTLYCVFVEGRYSLAISAQDIMYALDGTQHSLSELGNIGNYVKIGTFESEPCIELGSEASDFKLVITNKRILFMEGSTIPAYITNQSLHIKKAVIEEEMRLGKFVWQIRQNGNMGLVWQDAVEEVSE